MGTSHENVCLFTLSFLVLLKMRNFSRKR